MEYESVQALFSSLRANERVMGVDFGERKMGLALSDPTYLIATPYGLYMRRNMRQDLGELSALFKKEGVGALVVGLPLQADGSEGQLCGEVRRFTDKLIKKSGIGLYFQDERYTTAMASRAAEEAGLRRKASQEVDDKISAALILQQVLDMAKRLGIT
nr:Holliday junction resolvase RuvX [Anaplasma platys]